MLWDLGVGDTKNEAAVLEKIIEVEHSFNLVMIVERFQESLIFLKKELSWDYADVTSLKLNARVDEVRTTLNDSTRNLLKEFLRLDYLVYDHFYKIFEEKVKNFGSEKMEKELHRLSLEFTRISEECGLSEGRLEGDPRSNWGGKAGLQGFKAVDTTDDNCLMMTLRERQLVERIRKSQLNRLNKTVLQVSS